MVAQSKHIRNGQRALESFLMDSTCVRCAGDEDLKARLKNYPYKTPAVSVWGGTGKSSIRNRVEAICTGCEEDEKLRYVYIWESSEKYPNCQFFDCTKKIAGKGFCVNHRLFILKWFNLATRPMNNRGEGTTTSLGYVKIYDPSYKKARFVHRMVMEEFLGRQLLEEENIHHINGVRNDNRLENLELWVSSQPSGQRVIDIYDWAKAIINTYEKDIENGKIKRVS